MDLLRREVASSRLVVAIDPGKAFNRVWLTTGEQGLIGEPVSLTLLSTLPQRRQIAEPWRVARAADLFRGTTMTVSDG